MSNVFDKSWEPAVSVTVSLFVFVAVAIPVTVSVDPCDTMNNLCFHVFAQKCQMSSVKCQMLMLILGTC